ncbi:MAG: ribosome assembly cofactor RimP [Bacteroidetes bacterium GWF2_33_16]|nr:MAG: ribosome assembly cofactor RimP [Bacteroidetes bacterium GWE2_32_14]OFY03964.1 MAG: ribosome assembly cofactor RimP [Bacteroidetes bacterium GWF2_33_16]
MITKDDIIGIIQELVTQKDAYIVDVKIGASNQITIELDGAKGISIDDCVEVSKLIDSKLNRDEEDYELEVSSAGLSSAFKVIQQYYKNIGQEIEILVKNGKKLTGILKSVNENGFILEITKLERVEGEKKKQKIVEEIQLLFTDVKSTKLVIHFK